MPVLPLLSPRAAHSLLPLISRRGAFRPPRARFKKSRSFCSFGYHAHLTDVAPSSVGKILGFSNTVGIFVGILANLLTGKILDATGSFSAIFGVTAAIYISEAVVFLTCVRGGKLM